MQFYTRKMTTCDIVDTGLAILLNAMIAIVFTSLIWKSL